MELQGHMVDGQGGLVCCNSWDRKEFDTTERLKWTELNWILFSIVAVPNYIPTNSVWVPFSPQLHQHLLYAAVFYNSSDRCEVIYECVLSFPWWLVPLSIFSCACCLNICLLWRNVCHILCAFFNQVVCFLDVESCEFFIYFGY